MNYFTIDIFDLNPIDDISYVNDIQQNDSKLRIIYNHILQLVKSLTKRKNKGKIDLLFYGTTINNQRSFEPIIKNTKLSHLNISNNYDFEISQYMLWSFLFIIPWIINFFIGSKERKNKIRKNKIKYLLTYGKFIVARRLLKKYQPKILILANDHSNMNRCLLRNAISLGIKTLYVQHASVSNQFPKLEFDYSFLDGLISLDAYQNFSKKNSMVIISGPCRYDYMGKYLNNVSKYIGISINEFDEFEFVSNLCIKLKKAGIEHIKVRPHPSMGLWHKDWFNFHDIAFSSPAMESPGDYLSSLKIQISNVSGIHLDAVILKVPSVLYKLSKKSIPDIFGFKERNIIMNAETYEDLLSFIQKPNFTIKNTDVQFFVASYNTEIEFNVGKFISKTIDDIIESNFDNDIVAHNIPKSINFKLF